MAGENEREVPPQPASQANANLYTFQSTISAKLYIIALVYGDLKSKQLYTRIHSSCVTSETIQGMDCDCVEHLNGALEKIAQMQTESPKTAIKVKEKPKKLEKKDTSTNKVEKKETKK